MCTTKELSDAANVQTGKEIPSFFFSSPHFGFYWTVKRQTGYGGERWGMTCNKGPRLETVAVMWHVL